MLADVELTYAPILLLHETSNGTGVRVCAPALDALFAQAGGDFIGGRTEGFEEHADVSGMRAHLSSKSGYAWPSNFSMNRETPLLQSTSAYRHVRPVPTEKRPRLMVKSAAFGYRFFTRRAMGHEPAAIGMPLMPSLRSRVATSSAVLPSDLRNALMNLG